MNDIAELFIIIPTFNSELYLDSCLSSILNQDNDFNLHVHVQDGVSCDSTCEIVDNWINTIKNSGISLYKNKKLTLSSELDDGIYDAIAMAIKKCAPLPRTIMTWLGSDDILAAGSLSTVVDIFKNNNDIHWITGIPQVIDSHGLLYSPYLHRAYSQFNILCGNHDGRNIDFIQQEGTFWRSSLYYAAGGIDKHLKFAGDYDLWLKFSKITPLITIDFQLANFRVRPGQTSSQVDKYYSEIEEIRKNHNNIPDNIVIDRANFFDAIRLKRFSEANSWEKILIPAKIDIKSYNFLNNVKNNKLRKVMKFKFIAKYFLRLVVSIKNNRRKTWLRVFFIKINIQQ